MQALQQLVLHCTSQGKQSAGLVATARFRLMLTLKLYFFYSSACVECVDSVATIVHHDKRIVSMWRLQIRETV